MLKRIITALVLIPFAIIMVFYPSPSEFLFLTSLLSLWGFWEWSGLMSFSRTAFRLAYVLCAMLCLLALIMLIKNFEVNSLVFFYSVFGWWLLALLLVMVYPRARFVWAQGTFLRGLMGLWVIIPCCMALNFIRNEEAGFIRLLFVFVLIWGADSAAYFCGKKWGKHRLAPLVSPGKTWEGCVGALIFVLLLTLITLWYVAVPLSFWPWAFALSILTFIFSIVGDLFESMMKREAGLKDSGHFLPGHGGLLDRIDSLTAAAPVFSLGALWLGTYVR